MVQSSSLEEKPKKYRCKSEAMALRLYGLPKIHKDNVPLHPIISEIGTATYSLAKHLSLLFQPYIGQTETYVRCHFHI